MPAKLRALVEKGKELEGWTSAADIVREMEREGEMTLRRKRREEGWRLGGREERVIQGMGKPNLWKGCLYQLPLRYANKKSNKQKKKDTYVAHFHCTYKSMTGG